MRNTFSKEQMVLLLLYKVGTANTEPEILNNKNKTKMKMKERFY